MAEAVPGRATTKYTEWSRNERRNSAGFFGSGPWDAHPVEVRIFSKVGLQIFPSVR